MLLRLFSLLLLLELLVGCSKTYRKCLASTKPGVEGEISCPSGPSSDGGAADAKSDASLIEVKPWICEGKAKPWCFQGSDTVFTKTYPKMDKTTCEILDDTRNREVPMEKCEIPEADLLEAQAILPKGLEILGLQKGSLEDGQPIYRVSYRTGFDFVTQIFDAKGKSLPLDTPLHPGEGMSDKEPIACDEGYPVFCRKQSDGSYKFDDPIRIDVEGGCPIYQAPPDAVDESLCRD